MDQRTKVLAIVGLHLIMLRVSICLILFTYYMSRKYDASGKKRKHSNHYSLIDRIPAQVMHMQKLVHLSDSDCIDNFRMDRNAFSRLCHFLEHAGGLHDEKYVSVQEQTAIFLHVLAHDTKNRAVRFEFNRSGHTVSKYFNRTLNALLMIYHTLLPNPQPVTENCTNDTWKCFKGCLGALDGTYIKVRVPSTDKEKYRSRNREICTNVLGVCDRDMKFVYILSGREGSAADYEVLQDAINRPNGLKIPSGNYYLCDNAHKNDDGFLTPYKDKRGNLEELGEEALRPCDFQEYFNMKHYKARKIIERAFEHLKNRWTVLKSNTFYQVKVQNKIIMACALLHNFIRTEMAVDPLDVEFPEYTPVNDPGVEYVDPVEPSEFWDNWRDTLAKDMYDSWLVN